MAAASSYRCNTKFIICCLHCNWSLLCDPCGSAYENGTFCQTFHRETSGWSNCKKCQKPLHTGCIMSRKDFVFMDFGGICCVDCKKKSLIQADSAHLPVNDCFKNESYAQPMIVSPETYVQLISPCKEQTSVIEANPIANISSSEMAMSSEPHVDGARPIGVSSGLNPPEKKHSKVLGDLNSTKTTLFQKVPSPSDTVAKNGRLVIAKKDAEAYLPKLNEPKGVALEVQDTAGKIWNLNYRYWVNSKGRMYVLEGLRHYITSWDWQPGDRVKFYRIEPEGKLLMATKKKDDPPASKGNMPIVTKVYSRRKQSGQTEHKTAIVAQGDEVDGPSSLGIKVYERRKATSKKKEREKTVKVGEGIITNQKGRRL